MSYVNVVAVGGLTLIERLADRLEAGKGRLGRREAAAVLRPRVRAGADQPLHEVHVARLGGGVQGRAHVVGFAQLNVGARREQGLQRPRASLGRLAQRERVQRRAAVAGGGVDVGAGADELLHQPGRAVGDGGVQRRVPDLRVPVVEVHVGARVGERQHHGLDLVRPDHVAPRGHEVQRRGPVDRLGPLVVAAVLRALPAELVLVAHVHVAAAMDIGSDLAHVPEQARREELHLLQARRPRPPRRQSSHGAVAGDAAAYVVLEHVQ
mmetsp:Transcript_1586/g.4343  ORF Transcript_1586/g.4343 Transcript_1586/m.4343 type:complete len:266 (-) Transcript_1586:2413-3210(-)